jgi:hypothetical protein
MIPKSAPLRIAFGSVLEQCVVPTRSLVSSLPVRIVNVTLSPGRCRAMRRRTSQGPSPRLPSTATMISVGSRPALAAGDRRDGIDQRSLRLDPDAVAEVLQATAAAISCEVAISRRFSTCTWLSLATRRIDSVFRDEGGAVVDPREELLEQLARRMMTAS